MPYSTMKNKKAMLSHARKPRDAAAVRCGFESSPTFTTSLRVAMLQKTGFKAIDIPAKI